VTIVERSPLSRERIADTALRLIGERGLEQLSMRKLGAELGVEAMSLYNHVTNKDDLLDAVADLLYGKVLAEYGVPSGDWRAKARHLAASYVSVATTHREAFPLLLNRPPTVMEGLRFLERVVAIFDDVTDDLRTAALAFDVASNWVIGMIVGRLSVDFEQPEVPQVEGFERVEAFRRALQVDLGRRERFDEGLEAVLDGIEARYLRR